MISGMSSKYKGILGRRGSRAVPVFITTKFIFHNHAMLYDGLDFENLNEFAWKMDFTSKQQGQSSQKTPTMLVLS